jgi:hypothetical protein
VDVTTAAPAGEGAGAAVAGAPAVVGVDDGRVVVVVRPEPPLCDDGGDVVLGVGSGPVVVEVVEEEDEESGEVVPPEPVSAGDVVVVVEDGSGAVVVVVAESGGTVVVVVSVPVPGSALPESARAARAGTQTMVTNRVVRARPRRIRLVSTGISRIGSNGNAVDGFGPHRPSVTKANVPER